MRYTARECAMAICLCAGWRSVGVPAAEPVNQESPAIVQIGGCTGVCVDGSGLIMTARHCDLGDVERVRFANYEVLAVRVYEAEETEGPVVYDCAGEGYPAIDVSVEKPEIGEAVSAIGFPDHDGTRYRARTEGVVLQGGTYRFRGGEFLGNLTTLSLSEGWSGSPLLNQAGQVVGLATCSDGTDSVFISHAATRKAFDAARKLHDHKISLEVELLLTDKDSLRFLQDYTGEADLRRELQEHFQITVVDAQTKRDGGKVAGESTLPVFRVGQTVVLSGYPGKIELLRQLVPGAVSQPTAASEGFPESN